MASEQTRRAPSPSDFVLIDALLTMLSRRISGALDLGLVMLMEPPPERYSGYIEDHVAAPMRAAALVLRLAAAEALAEPATTPFQSIVVQTEAFVAALEDLRRFRSESETEVEATVDRLRAAFRRLRDCLLDVAERVGFRPTMASDTTPEREAFYEEILEGLHADLMAERGAGGTA
jgi:hypothetical protein